MQEWWCAGVLGPNDQTKVGSDTKGNVDECRNIGIESYIHQKEEGSFPDRGEQCLIGRLGKDNPAVETTRGKNE